MNWDEIPERKGEPNFENLLAVLRREVPDRPTLFAAAWHKRTIHTFYRLGYDFATILLPGFQFTDPDLRETKETFSLNEGAVIRNQQEFDSFEWPNPEEADYDLLGQLSKDLPKGMKLIPYSPDGVLENVIRLMGFDELCFKLSDDPRLVEDVFEQVGSRLVR